MLFLALVGRQASSRAMSHLPLLASLRWSHTAAGKHLFDLRPHYLPFEITAEEAKHRYLRWQRSKWFTPNNLLSRGNYTITPVMLPYWLFSMEAKVHYTGSIGTTSNNGQKSAGGSVSWRDVGWKTLQRYHFSGNELEMQVNACFTYRRDFTEAIKFGANLNELRPMSLAEADAQELHFSGIVDGPVALQPPEMRKAIAWEFAIRGAHDLASRDATQRLKEQYGVDQVKNVNVVLSPLSRQVSLMYVPAYSLSYVHGEAHNVHGERHPQQFHGLISGLKTGGVAGDRHVSIHKATTISGGLTLGVMGLLSVLSPLLGADPFMWSSFDFVFSALSVGATAGLVAQMAPGMFHQHAEDRRFRTEAELEAAAAEAAAAGGGGGFYTSPPDFTNTRDLEELHRTSLEWMRWEESDKATWNAEKRQRWAQQLWEAQHYRRRERRRLQQQAQREHERRHAEEIRERRRRSRWGPKSTPFSNEYMAATYGRFDYKGYYHVLDLDPQAGHVSQDDIKKAFRKAAMKWHPDKHRDADEKQQARKQFQKIRTAYDALKDPERRKSYDLGQLHRSHSE